jgi:hypothetical protein
VVSKSKIVRRWICRPRCWRKALRYANPRYTTRSSYFPWYESATSTYRPSPKRYATQSPRPTQPDRSTFPLTLSPAVLIGLLLSPLAVVFGKGLIRHVNALASQRRIDRVIGQTATARALTDRLDQDAYDADLLIRAYAKEAYRKGFGR